MTTVNGKHETNFIKNTSRENSMKLSTAEYIALVLTLNGKEL